MATKAPSSRLPSFVSVLRGLSTAWVAAAAVGQAGARPLASRQPGLLSDPAWDAYLKTPSSPLDARLARALMSAEGSAAPFPLSPSEAARAPTPVHAPSPVPAATRAHAPAPIPAAAPGRASAPIPAAAPKDASAPAPAAALADTSAPVPAPAPKDASAPVPAGVPGLAPVPAPAPSLAPAPVPAPAPSANVAPLPPTGVITPVSVSGTRFVDANGAEVFLLGPNLAANDACGVAARSTDATLGLYRAYAEAMAFNMIAQDVILTQDMVADPTAMAPFVDIAERVARELPGVTLLIRPLTDVGLDDRSVPTADYGRMMATLASRLRGLPVGISLGKELHRSHADAAAHSDNAAVNQGMRAALDQAYTTIRAANPDILLLMPGMLDPTSGAQYSRSAAAYVGNFNYTNAAVAVDLYTTEATEAGQWAQIQSWALGATSSLPIIVTELAPFIDSTLGVNMTEGVFNRTFAAFANRGVPVALWSGEFQCAPSMLDAPWSPGQGLDLNRWGRLAASWIRSYIG